MGAGSEGDQRSNAEAGASVDEDNGEAAELSCWRDAVNERVHQHLDLVDVIARHVSLAIEGVVEFEELVAAGNEGLLDAARRFDPKRGIPFHAFAGFRIEGAIVDGVRKSFRLPRRLYARLVVFEATRVLNEGGSPSTLRASSSYAQPPIAEKELSEQLAAMATASIIFHDLGIAPDSAEGTQVNPEDAYAHAELLWIVRKAIDDLGEHEATVIRLHYFEGKSFETAAETMRISKPWANRLHARGIESLTKRLRDIERP